jgi:hypothetical protein
VTVPLALDDVAPAFRARLAGAARRIEREGEPPALAGATAAAGSADGVRRRSPPRATPAPGARRCAPRSTGSAP